VAHVWELGGGSTAFAELLTIVLTQQRLPSNVVVVVVDLAKPAESLANAARWLEAVRARCTEITDKLGGGRGGKGGVAAAAESSSAAAGGGIPVPSGAEAVRACAQARLRVGWAQRGGVAVTLAAVGLAPPSAPATIAPAAATAAVAVPPARPGTSAGLAVAPAAAVVADASSAPATDPSSSPAVVAITSPAVAAHVLRSLPDHPDARMLVSTLLPLQLVVVGHKWDAVRDADLPKRKAVVAALRYLAHCFGGHLVATSTRDKASLGLFRAVLGHCVFGSEGRRVPAVDVNKAIAVPVGGDSVEAIGLPIASPGAPPATRTDVEAGPFAARFERYLAPVRHFFPPAAAAAAAGAGAAGDDVDVSNAPPPPSAIVPGVPVVFADEASRFAEPVVDMIRVAKADEAARYAREQDRKLKMEAKAQATAAASGGPAGAGAGAGTGGGGGS